MRKFLFALIASALLSSAAAADTIISSDIFPDPAFREYIRLRIDTNNDDILQDEEISKASFLSILSRNVSSLEGIGVFTEMEYLACPNNNITTLDLSRNPKLAMLYCNNNNITTLDLSHNTELSILDCRNTNLTTLDLSHNPKLSMLDCDNNNLTSLDLSHNPKLVTVRCTNNPMTAINLGSNSELTLLDCSDTKIGTSGLNISGVPNIQKLLCSNCGLSELNISSNDNLTSLVCGGNSIRTLDLAGKTQLQELYCSDCPITESLDIHNVVYTSYEDSIYSDGEIFLFLINVELGENVDSADIKGFDTNGEPVNLVAYDTDFRTAIFDAEPAILTYSYNTGNDNINLSAAILSDKAKNLAPCTNGIFEGIISGDIISWKGVPYAKSPAGSLRWKAPQAPDASSKIFAAFTYADTPIQHYSDTSPKDTMPPRGEDCLALNVWTNSRDMSALKPVMVWIHGGTFNSGATGSPKYDGQKFIEAHDDVVLVTVGFRVGIMGFIDFINSGIAGCENFPDSQNLGLLDVLQALRWLHENIRAFGGDPENITLFGQSSGSAMISLVAAMPESAGLFRRIITQSGAVSMTAGSNDCKTLTQKLVQLTGADTMDKLIALSSSDLQDAAEKLQGFTNFPERDGRIVAADPYRAFARNAANFDLMAGTMKDEANVYALVLGGIEQLRAFAQRAYTQLVGGINRVSSEDAARADEFVRLYLAKHDGASDGEAETEFMNELLFRGPVITQTNSHAGKKYVYYWEYPAALPGFGASHELDVPYIFNNSDHFLTDGGYNQKLANEVQAMWVNFAKTGSPSTESIIWPEYSTETQAVMVINEPMTVRDGNLSEEYELMQPLMKYGFSGREVLGAMAGGTDADSGDVVPQGTLGSSGGGCDAGFALPVMIGLVMFAASRKL